MHHPQRNGAYLHNMMRTYTPMCCVDPPLCDLAGALFGILGKFTNKYGRDLVILLGMLVHLLTFLLIFFNLPDNAINALVPADESKGYLLMHSKLVCVCVGVGEWVGGADFASSCMYCNCVYVYVCVCVCVCVRYMLVCRLGGYMRCVIYHKQ